MGEEQLVVPEVEALALLASDVDNVTVPRGCMAWRAKLATAALTVIVVSSGLAINGQGPTHSSSPIEDSIVMSEMETSSPILASWRIDSNAPLLLSPARKIFDAEKCESSLTPISTMTTDTISSSSADGLASAMSASLGLEGSYQAFDGAASASVQHVSATTHKTFRMDQIVRFEHGKLSSSVFAPSRCLTDDSRKFLLEAPVSKIHHNMGDFFATEITLGGLVQTTLVTEMTTADTKSSMEATLEASFDGVFVSAKTSMSGGASVEATVDKRKVHAKSSAFGGDTSIWMKLSTDNAKQVQEEWGDSITAENEYPVNFRIAPLWELLTSHDMDPDKADELRTFMLGQWKSQVLPDMPPVEMEHGGAATEYIGCFDRSQLTVKQYYGWDNSQFFNSMYVHAKDDFVRYFAMSRHAKWGHAYTVSSIDPGAAHWGHGPCGTKCKDDGAKWCGCHNQKKDGYPNPDCPVEEQRWAVYTFA